MREVSSSILDSALFKICCQNYVLQVGNAVSIMKVNIFRGRLTYVGSYTIACCRCINPGQLCDGQFVALLPELPYGEQDMDDPMSVAGAVELCEVPELIPIDPNAEIGDDPDADWYDLSTVCNS